MLQELNIIPVTLPLPFRLDHVNCFLAEGENGWTIIDTGLHNRDSESIWDNFLQDKHIDDIIITHYHPDHFGFAGAMQKLTDANVSMSEIDRDIGNKTWQPDFIRETAQHYPKTGAPQNLIDDMTQNTTAFIDLVTPEPKVNHLLQEGEKFQFGKYMYEVIFTPGHSDGLVCFYNKDRDVLFSTDHILPKITPNISYWFHGDPNPLKTYQQSLYKMKELDADLVIPSHGKPFHGANDRIEEILAHHERRLNQTLDTIRNGNTVYEACNELFEKELTVHEYRFAIGETLAHLEYLRFDGQCAREERNGVWHYTV